MRHPERWKCSRSLESRRLGSATGMTAAGPMDPDRNPGGAVAGGSCSGLAQCYSGYGGSSEPAPVLPPVHLIPSPRPTLWTAGVKHFFKLGGEYERAILKGS